MFDAFISYSHDPDLPLAQRLQRAIATVGNPGYRRARRAVFRDETELGYSPDLQASLVAALRDSRWLLVLASARALRSPWVRAELELWRAERPADRIVVLDVDGALAADRASNDADAAAVTGGDPAADIADDPVVDTGSDPASDSEQDLGWLLDGVPDGQVMAVGSDPADSAAGIGLQAVAIRVAALLDDVSEDEVATHVAVQRSRRFRSLVAASTVVLLGVVVSVVAAVVQSRAAAAAQSDRRVAVAAALAAESEGLQRTDPQQAGLLAVAAYGLHRGAQAEHALANAAQEERWIPPYHDVPVPGGAPVAVVPAAGGLVVATAAGRLSRWNPERPTEPTRELPALASKLGCLLAGPDGEALAVDVQGRVVSVGRDGAVRAAGTVTLPEGAQVSAGAAAGSLVVLGDTAGSLTVIDRRTLKVLHRVVQAHPRVVRVAVDDASMTVVSAGTDQYIAGWGLAASGVLSPRWRGANRWTSKGSPQTVSDLGVGSGQGLVAVASSDGYLRVFRLGDGTLVVPSDVELTHWHGQGTPVVVRWDAGTSAFLSAGGDRVLSATDPKTGLERYRWDRNRLPAAPTVLLAHEGGYLVGTSAGYLRWIPAMTEEAALDQLAPVTTQTTAHKIMGDDDTAVRAAVGASARHGAIFYDIGDRFRAYLPDAKAPRTVMAGTEDQTAAAVLAAAGQLAVAHHDGTLTLHDLADGRRVARMPLLDAPVRGLASGSTAAGWVLAGFDGARPQVTVRLEGRDAPLTLPTGRPAAVVGAAVLSGGLLGTVDAAGQVDVWQLPAGSGAPARLRSLRPARPGKLLPVDARGEFAVADIAGVVTLLDGKTLEQRLVLDTEAGDVVGVDVVGDRVVVAGAYSGIALFDAVSADPVTPAAERGGIPLVGLVRAGPDLLAVYYDSVVLRVRWDPVAAGREVCAWAGRGLSADEARRFGLAASERPCEA